MSGFDRTLKTSSHSHQVFVQALVFKQKRRGTPIFF